MIGQEKGVATAAIRGGSAVPGTDRAPGSPRFRNKSQRMGKIRNLVVRKVRPNGAAEGVHHLGKLDQILGCEVVMHESNQQGLLSLQPVRAIRVIGTRSERKSETLRAAEVSHSRSETVCSSGVSTEGNIDPNPHSSKSIDP